MGANQTGTQFQLVEADEVLQNQVVGEISLFDENDEPIRVAQNRAPVVTGSAIGTVAKTTTAPEPPVNSIVAVKFTNGNSANSPTLAFNGGDARDILLGGTASTGAKLTVAAGGVALFFFDGEDLHQIGAYT